MIAWSVFIYTFVYQLILMFIVVVVWNFFSPWPNSWWNSYFFYSSLVIPGIIGIISTVWFTVGGFLDTLQLFRDLGKRIDDPNDNGQVSNNNKPTGTAEGEIQPDNGIVEAEEPC